MYMLVRDSKYDIMKGIAILCVIIGHLPSLPPSLFRLILSFHMPLFFMLSGIFFRPEKYSLQRDIKRLLIPFLFSCGVIFLIRIIKSSNLISSFENMACEIFWSCGAIHDCEWFSSEPRIGVLWFLIALFFARAFYFCVCKIVSSEIYRTLLCVFLSVIGVYLDTTIIYLPFALNQSLSILIYLQFGHLIAKYSIKTWMKTLCMILWIYPALFYTMDMCACHYDGWLYPIVVFGSVGGGIFIGLISEKMKQCDWMEFEWLGQLTLPIMCFHAIIYHEGAFLFNYGKVIAVVLWIFLPIACTLISAKIEPLRVMFGMR